MRRKMSGQTKITDHQAAASHHTQPILEIASGAMRTGTFLHISPTRPPSPPPLNRNQVASTEPRFHQQSCARTAARQQVPSLRSTRRRCLGHRQPSNSADCDKSTPFQTENDRKPVKNMQNRRSIFSASVRKLESTGPVRYTLPPRAMYQHNGRSSNSPKQPLSIRHSAPAALNETSLEVTPNRSAAEY